MNITAKGTSAPLPWPGGYGTLIVAGDLDGNDVTIEGDYDVGEWIIQRDLGGEPIVIRNTTTVNFLTAKCTLRLNVDGGGESPDIKYSLRVLPVQVAQRY